MTHTVLIFRHTIELIRIDTHYYNTNIHASSEESVCGGEGEGDSISATTNLGKSNTAVEFKPENTPRYVYEFWIAESRATQTFCLLLQESSTESLRGLYGFVSEGRLYCFLNAKGSVGHGLCPYGLLRESNELCSRRKYVWLFVSTSLSYPYFIRIS